jgi:WD40 repeat protein
VSSIVQKQISPSVSEEPLSQDEQIDVFQKTTSMEDLVTSSQQHSRSSVIIKKGLRRFHHHLHPEALSITQREVNARCVDAHPDAELFATGDSSGRVHVWDFRSVDGLVFENTKVSEDRIQSVLYNQRGDKILCCDVKGHVSIIGEPNLALKIDSSDRIRWFNADNQFVVTQSMKSQFLIYDLLVGDRPVATFPFKKQPQHVYPFAVHSTQLCTGMNDGSVIIFDTRMGMVAANMSLHQQPVTCVEYDKSGTFFVTGSSDNSVNVVEVKEFIGIQFFGNLLPDYNASSPKKGILSLALSKQTIVACGHTGIVHVWSVNEA